MLKKLCLILSFLSFSNITISADSEDFDLMFDEFCVEEENLIGCLCCRNLAIFIFLENDELYGLCFNCYLGG